MAFYSDGLLKIAMPQNLHLKVVKHMMSQNSTELNRKMSFIFIDKGIFDDMSDIEFPFEKLNICPRCNKIPPAYTEEIELL